MLSPLLPDREVLAEDPQGRVHHHNGGTVVPFPGLVSSSDGEPSGTSLATPKLQRSAKESTRSLSPTGGARAPTTKHLQGIRKHHTATEVSKEASDLLLAGWSKETNSTYQSGWARWCLWCNEREVDPVSCEIQTFLDFLADIYGQGLQYRTINAIRSAVSTTHNTIENTPIGHHLLVSRLMKGIYNSRPPEPRYSNTWDVTTVLTWLKGQGSQDSELFLKDLSGKLALLMVLLSTNRTSELHALDCNLSPTPQTECYSN